MIKIPEPYRAAAKAAKKLHWTITRTGSGHLKWQPPAGRPCFTSCSPGGANRSIENDLSHLRKAGLEW